jgi:hypothetical protein
MYGVPESVTPYLEIVDVLIGLKMNDAKDKVKMTLVKEHDKVIKKPLAVCLDPKTMLISK